jgi:flagellar basal-body rod protein FlgG
MIRGLYTASAGMQVESLRQETIANNLANLNTNGFKRDLALVTARENMTLKRTNNAQSKAPFGETKNIEIGHLGTGVLLDRFAKRFDDGNYQQTENPLDMAIQGDGYFTVQDAQGEKLYTRGGDFTLDNQGQLVTKAGMPVIGESGGPITLPRGKFTVGEDGIVMAGGRVIDRLAMVRFEDPDAQLEKMGDVNFRFSGDGEPEAATGVRVKQGMLEGSNVNSVQEMTHMIMALRQYEANQKAAHHQDETLAKAVNEIARS